MSDTYDYVYGHRLQHMKEPCSYENTTEEKSFILSNINTSHGYCASPVESNIGTKINTADFSPRDLQIFIDCLEAIARLEQAKSTDAAKRKVKKPRKAPKKIQITCLDSSDCDSLDEDDVNSFSDLSLSSSSEYLYDETYFGLSNQGQSTAIYSNLMSCTVPIASDSEDSGIFVRSPTTGHLYENIEPLKPKSKIVSYSKRKSLKSRLISLFLKKHHAMKTQKPTIEILTSTTIGDQHDSPKAKEVMKPQSEDKKSKKKKHKNILTKAFRMLTL